MKRLTHLNLSLFVLCGVVALCELAAFGAPMDCHEPMLDNNNSCAECRQWFAFFGSYHRCKETEDGSVCFGPVPNSPFSCEDTRPNCPGPAKIYDDEDPDCNGMPVAENPICPSWRKYDKGVGSAATSGCD